jgi:hypothetical protein
MQQRKPKFHKAEPIKANLAQNSPKLSIVGLRAEQTVSRRRVMGCLMKNGIATNDSLSHDYYVLQINGRPKSIHRRYEDALRAGLLRRYQSPRDEIKVFEISSTEEVMAGTVLH